VRRWLIASALAAPMTAAAQNMAAEFDGEPDHILLGSIDPGDSYTVEAWVELGVEEGETLICAADTDHLNAFCVQYRVDTWIVEINDDDDIEADTCTDNQPHLCHLDDRSPGPSVVHVAATVTPTEMALHIDGVRVATAETGEDTDWTGAEWALGIDAESGGWSSDGLHGLLDEVRLWDHAREEAEIACTMDWALTGAEPGLVGYWPLDAAPGGVTPDATGNGHDGTLVEEVELISSPFALTPSAGGDIPCFDFDGDAVTPQDGDCDDTEASVHPGATDAWYDGVDADCDGANDYDADGDGYVDAAWDGMEGGTAPYRGDCDDGDASTHPGADDGWYDGVDSDCDGANDYDADGDGYVDAAWDGMEGGTAPHGGDCDDGDGNIHPDAPEILDDGVDQDCTGHDRNTLLTGGLDGECGCSGAGAIPGKGSIGPLLVLVLGLRRRRYRLSPAFARPAARRSSASR